MSYNAFMSLNVYLGLAQTNKPTQEQAEKALGCLCEIYGVKSEQELIEKGNLELTDTYFKAKQKILSYV